MANRNAPAGFLPVSYLNGADWNGQARRYYIPAGDTNAYYIGDLVKSAAGASDGRVQNEVSIGTPIVEKCAAGDITRGAIIGFGMDVVDLQSYLPATKSRGAFVYVADDPQLIFAVQGNNAAALDTTCIGQFADFIVTAPSFGGAESASVLDTSSIAANAALPLRILGLCQGDFTAYTKFLVGLNLHELG
jgi:hypothetical protein